MCPSEKDAKEQVRNPQEIRNLIERTKWSKKVCFSMQKSFQLILQQLPQKLLGRPQAAPQAAPQARAPLDVPLLGLGGPAWAVGMPSIENHQVIWNLSPPQKIMSSIHIVCLKIGMPRLLGNFNRVNEGFAVPYFRTNPSYHPQNSATQKMTQHDQQSLPPGQIGTCATAGEGTGLISPKGSARQQKGRGM